MPRLKIGAIADDTPVKFTVVLPAAVHRDLISYAGALARETGQTVEPAQLVAPMLMRFMSTDRAFLKWRRSQGATELGTSIDRHVAGARPREIIEQ